MIINNQIITRISEFFKTLYGLFLFTVKSLWIILKTDMDNNVQTYKEEREQQKKVKNGLK